MTRRPPRTRSSRWPAGWIRSFGRYNHGARMKKNLFASYWQVLEGMRARAVFLTCLGVAAGLLEGAALICLIPLFNTGMNADPANKPSFFELFNLAWNPADNSKVLTIFFICF